MGIARLLAKGWVLFCLFAGAHALRIALASGQALAPSALAIGICTVLFAAMGLLFVGGFGAAGTAGRTPLLQRLNLSRLIPNFSDGLFVVFVILSFLVQSLVAPEAIQSGVAGAVQSAIYFVVPGQRTLVDALDSCSMDGGRTAAAGFTWLLAIIYLGWSCSRLRLQAGLIRLEQQGAALGPSIRAFLFGLAAVVAIQFLFVGSAFPWLNCSAFADITGALLIGLAPLILAYVIVAALASLLASAPEK